jgi:hypothetical protein
MGKVVHFKSGYWVKYWLDSKLVGPKAGLDIVAKSKIFAPAGNRAPVTQSTAIHYTEWPMPAKNYK